MNDEFNLEEAIAVWRKRMAAQAVKSREILEELESHLRDDVEAQMKSGMSAQEGFEAAVERIGQPRALQREFIKTGDRKWLLRRTLKAFFIAIPAGIFELS